MQETAPNKTPNTEHPEQRTPNAEQPFTEQKITKASSYPHPLFSREARRIFWGGALLFLAEEGRATHAKPEVGWRVEVGWL